MDIKIKIGLLILTVLGALAGFMISVQINTQQLYSSDLSTQSPEALIAIVTESHAKQEDLHAQYKSSQQLVTELREQNLTETDLLEQLHSEADMLAIINGSAAVSGPGVTIRFENDQTLVSTDLIDIMNELWGTGAEAIAVGEQRITEKSSFGTVVDEGQVRLTVNGEVIATPIVIAAIGSSDDLEKGLTFPGGVLEHLDTLWGAKPVVSKEKSLILPAI